MNRKNPIATRDKLKLKYFFKESNFKGLTKSMILVNIPTHSEDEFGEDPQWR
jgi:hypothetical protein